MRRLYERFGFSEHVVLDEPVEVSLGLTDATVVVVEDDHSAVTQ
jgi:hypothetical protein